MDGTLIGWLDPTTHSSTHGRLMTCEAIAQTTIRLIVAKH